MALGAPEASSYLAAMHGDWEYARLRAVGGRWVLVTADDAAGAPILDPDASMSEALKVLDAHGWLLDPRWMPEWPYISLKRPRQDRGAGRGDRRAGGPSARREVERATPGDALAW